MNETTLSESVFNQVEQLLEKHGFRVIKVDLQRPWGGFFVIDESQAKDFVRLFFPDEDYSNLFISDKISPKILIVSPGMRLSWQYHHRRAEIWRCVEGPVAVATSFTDRESSIETLQSGDIIKLRQGERHRLIGLDSFGVIAEIWQHTDSDYPSDEEDIIRVQDDFGR
jgi:mannose-6-phosphate isomerase